MYISCLYYIKLPRSGWSVGRAGLGAKATYPAYFVQRGNNAVGIGLFPFNTPFK